MTSIEISNVQQAERIATALSQESTKELEALKTHSNSIKALGFFWLFAILVSGFFSFIEQDPKGLQYFFIVYTSLLIFPTIGCFSRYDWARKTGLAMCIPYLIAVPIGTILGLLGIAAFRKGAKLFGPDKYSHQSIVAELLRRKKAPIHP